MTVISPLFPSHPWLRYLARMMEPKEGRGFRCLDCGDCFEATWRRFPMPLGVGLQLDIKRNITVKLVEQFRANEKDVEHILCGNCGHEIWRQSDQVLLRDALDLSNEIPEKVREAWVQTEEYWVKSLTLDDFRRLDPDLFAALWEKGPATNSNFVLPKGITKQVRSYLRHGERQRKLWALRGDGTTLIDYCHALLLMKCKQVIELHPRLERLDKVDALLFGPFIPPLPFVSAPGDRPPDTQPMRGWIDGCYHPLDCDGNKLAAELESALVLDNYAGLAFDRNREGQWESIEARLKELLRLYL